MAKKFRDLVSATMTPEQQAEASARARVMLAEMALDELRQTRQLSQASVAALLDAAQSEVSRIENRRDLLVSTLMRYVKALGGELELIVHFPGGESVRISQFDEDWRGDTPAAGGRAAGAG